MPQKRQLAVAGVLSCLLIAAGGCGGDQRPEGARGGTLTMLVGSDVDFLDPGRTAFSVGAQVAAATQRPLYAYPPDDPTHLAPDLAAAAPKVSADGRTVTVRLRHGVRYSPPVDREVTSHDFAYAISRLFSASVAAPYAPYFNILVGAPPAPTDGVRAIRGIETPDAHTIVFRLRRPESAAFIGALTLAAAAPVPEEYARPFDARSPSTYNTHVVATGPYMVRNDRAGDTVGYQAGRQIDLVRNPNWRAATDYRPARLDTIRIRTNADDATLASKQVLAGSHMVYGVTPPPSVLRAISRNQTDSEQVARVPTGGYRFLPITTTIKPFDNVNVRRAMLAVFDRGAVRQARGGPATGPVATHFLAPGVPGFEEAGGTAGPGFDFMSAQGADGDLALAKAYMRRAGYPSGRYTGSESFLVVTGNTLSERNVAQIVKAQYEKLGFKIRLRTVPDDALFTDWCTVPAKRVLSCSGVVWLKDFPDPEPMLRPAFDGTRISHAGANYNFAQLDVPAINAAMARAAVLTGAERARAWGRIDRMIVGQAAAVPLQWELATLVQSKDVRGVASSIFASWDLSYTSLR